MRCKICLNKNIVKFKFVYTHEKIRYFQCIFCDFIFQHPIPSQDELKLLYNKNYFESNYKKSKEYRLRKIQYQKDKKISN